MSAWPARNPAVRMLAQRDMRNDRMRDANATRESAHHGSLILNCRPNSRTIQRSVPHY